MRKISRVTTKEEKKKSDVHVDLGTNHVTVQDWIYSIWTMIMTMYYGKCCITVCWIILSVSVIN